eukprot:m.276021 g.276021  ORF g.276021 m.276021 type:complete len:473 (-) comp78820_c0_seq1:29-1447(-)
MQAAMQQFQNMTPDQRRAMSQMVSNMDPNMIANMSSSMGISATPEQVAFAQQQAQKNPSTFNQLTPDHLNQQIQYQTSGAIRLKAEGNSLHEQGNYTLAVEKYQAAIEFLKVPSSETAAIRQACTLNLASCYIKLEKFGQAVTCCTEIIQKQNTNLKAFYRRGLAHEGLKNYAQSEEDLQNALKISPNDERVLEALKRVQQSLHVHHDVAPSSDRSSPLTPPASSNKHDTILPEPEQLDSKPKPAAAHSKSQHKNTSEFTPTATTLPPHITPEMTAMAQKQFQDNPEMFKNVFANTSPEQLAAMGAQSGLNVSPAQLQMAQQMMSNMSPEAMKSMMEMSTSLQGSMNAAGSSPGQPPQATPEMMKQLQEQMKNPETRKAMADMMTKLSPEQLSQMSQQAGVDISPEMAKQMGDKLKDMDPKTMESLMLWSARMQTLLAWLKCVYQVFLGTNLRAAVTIAVIAILLGHFFGLF